MKISLLKAFDIATFRLFTPSVAGFIHEEMAKKFCDSSNEEAGNVFYAYDNVEISEMSGGRQMKIISKANYERILDESNNSYNHLKSMLNSVFDIIEDNEAFDFHSGIVGSGDVTFVSSNTRKVIRFSTFPQQFTGFTINHTPVSLQTLLEIANKEKQRESAIKSVTVA